MDLQNPLIIQIAIDSVLLAVVIILLWRLNANIKNPSLINAQRKMTEELKTLIIESQTNADKFLRALEQARLGLKEIALELELKEKRVRNILDNEGRDNHAEISREATTEKVFSSRRYSEVLNMVDKGCSAEETARVTGFTEAEVGLISDLARIKNEIK